MSSQATPRDFHAQTASRDGVTAADRVARRQCRRCFLPQRIVCRPKMRLWAGAVDWRAVFSRRIGKLIPGGCRAAKSVHEPFHHFCFTASVNVHRKSEMLMAQWRGYGKRGSVSPTHVEGGVADTDIAAPCVGRCCRHRQCGRARLQHSAFQVGPRRFRCRRPRPTGIS